MKKLNILMILLVFSLIGYSPFTAFAQDGGFVEYQNKVFSVKIPDWLEISAEGDDYVAFENNGTSINISPVSLSSDARALLQNLGEDIDKQFLLVMELSFSESDYEIVSCSTLVNLPCVQFQDEHASEGILRRANIYDDSSGVFYAITFNATSSAEMARLQPDEVLASFELISSRTAPKTALFNVIVNGNVNVRSCGSTECEILGQATNGQVLSVVDEVENWYEVEWGTGTAFIAAWLTTRGPDVMVDLYDGYLDWDTGCILALRTKRGDNDLNIAISGEKHSEVTVDIYRPNETTPVSVSAQYDKTFIDTGDVYIHQAYYWGTWWPTGVYQIELTLDGKSSMIGFEIPNAGDHWLYVSCD